MIIFYTAETKTDKRIESILKALQNALHTTVVHLKNIDSEDATSFPCNDCILFVLDETKSREKPDAIIQKLKLSVLKHYIPMIVLNNSGQMDFRTKSFFISADHYIDTGTPNSKIVALVEELISEVAEMKAGGMYDKVCFVVRSTLNSLFEVNNIISHLFTEMGLGEDSIINLRLTLDELGTNAIRHGNKNDADKFVFINCLVFSDRLKISIKDQGEGFNVSDIPDPTSNERILLPSGRGVFLARQLMDEVRYVGRGNIVEFEKQFSPRPRHEHSAAHQ